MITQLAPLFAVVLDIELTNGNDGRNKRWFKPAKIRKQMEELLRAKRLVPSRPFPKPVVLKITRLLGKASDCGTLIRADVATRKS